MALHSIQPARQIGRFGIQSLNGFSSQALTVGVQTVMNAQEVLILVSGSHKAVALRMAVEEGINHMCTVSAFQMHPNAVFVCDEASTLELRVKTVNYFKDLMKIHKTLAD